MTEQGDIAYYDGRAAVERELARTARDESVASIHDQLAKRYELMARQAEVDGVAEIIPIELNGSSAGPA